MKTLFKIATLFICLILISSTAFSQAGVVKSRSMPDQLDIVEDDQEGDVLSFGAPKSWIIKASKSWMSFLPDNTMLSNMSIPGTHDAATGVYRGGLVGVITQEWTIKQQLEAGIRWFDLRLRRTKDGKFALQHGNEYLGIELDELLNDVEQFLADHPTEGILFHYQYQGWHDETYTNDEIWDTYTNKFKSFLVDEDQSCENMTLGEIRGKMIKLGIYNTSNLDKQNYYHVTYLAHDFPINDGEDSKISLSQKIRFAREYVKKATDSADSLWFLNGLSGATGMLPHDVARALIPDIYKHIGYSLKPSTYTKLGIVMMDYPGEKMICRIIKSNFIPKTIEDCGCPANTFRQISDHSWVEFRLPNGQCNSEIKIPGGCYHHYAWLRCNRVVWSDLTFKCTEQGKTSKWILTKGDYRADGLCYSAIPQSEYIKTGNCDPEACK